MMNRIKQANDVQVFTLANGVMEVVLCNYGGTIVSIRVPDKHGKKKNVVAGFRHPDEYKTDHPYFGSTIGRYANRIAFGTFKIDGKEYSLATNDKPNHLHGGKNGFNRQLWQSEQRSAGVSFSYLSEDGEEGYPGNLRVTVDFSLASDNSLTVTYAATTDKDTIVSLTNHAYFNLSGFESSTIHDHLLKIYASAYTAKNEYNVPSGEINSVAHTPYDFTHAKPIGEDIDLLAADMGYDVNYVLHKGTSVPVLAAELYEPESGRLLKVVTDQPGMQLYTANRWDGSIVGEQNKPYGRHGAVALETQAFPDSPNHQNFPNTVLRPGQAYRSQTTYQFLVV